MSTSRFYDRVRNLTLHLAEIPSVNGTQGEAEVLEDAYGLLQAHPLAGHTLRVSRARTSGDAPPSSSPICGAAVRGRSCSSATSTP